MTIEEVYKKWQSLQPLTGEQEQQLSRKFSIEYNYNSNHLEGNTLTYGQTELLLLFGKMTGNGDLKDFSDMKASQVSVRMMTEASQEKDTPLTQNFIRQLHKVLLREDYTVYRNLPGGMTTSYVVHAGQYKLRPNSVITRYGDRFEYASPEETPALMTDLVDWYNSVEPYGKYTPVELAALFHYRYIRIHPFEDGNGRIARLLANYILARHGWPMIVVRNRNKREYLNALHKADLAVGASPSAGANATLDKARHFVKYFTQIVRDEIQADISFLETKADNVWWYDGLPLKFRSETGFKILRMMRENPYITYSEMTQRLGINTSAVQKMVANMKAKGYIDRLDDGGGWYVFAIPTVQ